MTYDGRLEVSRGNVESFLRGIDDWNRGDRDAWLSEVPPNWEFHTTGMFPGLQPVYRGETGAAELWDVMREPWERFDVAVERVEDLGETIVGLVTFKVRGRDGLEISRRWGYIATYSEGAPVRTDNFASWDEVLAVAGLS